MLEIAAALAELSQDPRLAVQMAAAGVLHPVATLLKQSPPRSQLMSNTIMLAWNALAASPEALLNEPRALPSDDHPGGEGEWDDLEEEGEENKTPSEDASGNENESLATALKPTNSFVDMSQLQTDDEPGDVQGQSRLFSEASSELEQFEDQPESPPAPEDASHAQQHMQPIDNKDMRPSNAAASQRQPLKVRNTTATADSVSLTGQGRSRSKAEQPSAKNIGSRTISRMKPASPRIPAGSGSATSQQALQPGDSGMSSPKSSRSSPSSPDPVIPALDLQSSIAQAAAVEALDSRLEAEAFQGMPEEAGPSEDDPINLDPTELGARMRARKSSQADITAPTGHVSYLQPDQAASMDPSAATAGAESKQAEGRHAQQGSPAKGSVQASRSKSPGKAGRPLTAGTDKSGTSSMGRRRMVRSDSEGSGWASHSGGGVAHALAEAISQLLQWAMREGRVDADRILASDAMSLALVLAQQSIGHQSKRQPPKTLSLYLLIQAVDLVDALVIMKMGRFHG